MRIVWGGPYKYFAATESTDGEENAMKRLKGEGRVNLDLASYAATLHSQAY